MTVSRKKQQQCLDRGYASKCVYMQLRDIPSTDAGVTLLLLEERKRDDGLLSL